MPTNVYFDTGTTSEQRLYEDLIIEQLKIYGQDVYYLPRKLANKDTIFGEDPASSFDDSYIIEMYVDNTDGYMGEQEIIKKFGLEEIKQACPGFISIIKSLHVFIQHLISLYLTYGISIFFWFWF